jgi:hypothetical protein
MAVSNPGEPAPPRGSCRNNPPAAAAIRRPVQPRPPARAEALELRRLLAAFSVTTEADVGPGSLRQAVLDANATPERDGITFAIPTAAGVTPTIRPLSPLPAVTAPLVIDGGSWRGGGVQPPRVNLDGRAAGAGADGIVLSAEQSAVYGMAIYGFSRNGVVLSGGYTTRASVCYLGLTAGGESVGNGDAGVLVTGGGGTVGGSGPSEQPLPNVISGNLGPGVRVSGLLAPPGFSTSNVLFNLIGTSPAGDTAVPNAGGGVAVDTADYANIAGNTISGNRVGGVQIAATAMFAQLLGNRIGTDAAGTAPVPNEGPGITTAASYTHIGGASSPAGNIIANNHGPGVVVLGNTTGTTIMSNQIARNGGLGIDLGGDGVTPNDPLDADAGPNGRQNYPRITGVTGDGSATTVTVSLSSAPNRRYRVELFFSAAADPSGHGEGERLLKSMEIATGADGEGTSALTFTPQRRPGGWLTTTATDGGSTSEFSPAVSALRARPVFRPQLRSAAPTPLETAMCVLFVSRPRDELLQ